MRREDLYRQKAEGLQEDMEKILRIASMKESEKKSYIEEHGILLKPNTTDAYLLGCISIIAEASVHRANKFKIKEVTRSNAGNSHKMVRKRIWIYPRRR